MENKLFRKESMDHISSPEQLHDYMRVTSPRLWMLLTAILALLVGFLVYAATVTMESTMDLIVSVDYGYISADLPLDQADLLKIHMPVRIEGRTGYISNISQATEMRLEMTFDGNTVLEDGFYQMDFVDPDELPDNLGYEYYFLSVNKGVIVTYSGNPSFQSVFDKDRRVLVEGKLATVTHAEPYDVASLTIALDNPGTPLPDGTYPAQIITESTTPISFLLN